MEPFTRMYMSFLPWQLMQCSASTDDQPWKEEGQQWKTKQWMLHTEFAGYTFYQHNPITKWGKLLLLLKKGTLLINRQKVTIIWNGHNNIKGKLWNKCIQKKLAPNAHK